MREQKHQKHLNQLDQKLERLESLTEIVQRTTPMKQPPETPVFYPPPLQHPQPYGMYPGYMMGMPLSTPTHHMMSQGMPLPPLMSVTPTQAWFHQAFPQQIGTSPNVMQQHRPPLPGGGVVTPSGGVHVPQSATATTFEPIPTATTSHPVAPSVVSTGGSVVTSVPAPQSATATTLQPVPTATLRTQLHHQLCPWEVQLLQVFLHHRVPRRPLCNQFPLRPLHTQLHHQLCPREVQLLRVFLHHRVPWRPLCNQFPLQPLRTQLQLQGVFLDHSALRLLCNQGVVPVPMFLAKAHPQLKC